MPTRSPRTIIIERRLYPDIGQIYRDKFKSLFAKAGQVVDCHLAMLGASGRGFAFVEYETHGEALEAFEDFQGEKFDDQVRCQTTACVSLAQHSGPYHEPRSCAHLVS